MFYFILTFQTYVLLTNHSTDRPALFHWISKMTLMGEYQLHHLGLPLERFQFLDQKLIDNQQ